MVLRFAADVREESIFAAQRRLNRALLLGLRSGAFPLPHRQPGAHGRAIPHAFCHANVHRHVDTISGAHTHADERYGVHPLRCVGVNNQPCRAC